MTEADAAFPLSAGNEVTRQALSAALWNGHGVTGQQVGTLHVSGVVRWHQETPYSQPDNWVFPSFRLKGKKPRCAKMLVEDYLRPAAVNAEVLARDDPHRFRFHNLRHSLASFLVRTKTDPKTGRLCSVART